VEREAGEEDCNEGHPLEVLNQGANQSFLPGTVADDGEGDVTDEIEDGEEGDQDCGASWLARIRVRLSVAKKDLLFQDGM
jgi:hypothetical protein